MMVRKVKLARPSRSTIEGAGVYLHRAFGSGDEKLFDPFLMLDDFRGGDPSRYLPGFPWHPHRGIETITYVIEGEVDHGDSMGNEGTIGAGDVQWMTAGSGIIHQEMPRGDPSGRMGGFQLWLNLPMRLKMTDPRYQSITAREIPESKSDGARVRVIAGALGEVSGPVENTIVKAEYFDVDLEPDSEWRHPTAAGRTAFAYLFEGTARFGESSDLLRAEPGMIVLLDAGDQLSVTAGPDGARFLFASGEPLHEPIAWRGPIVMNYAHELEEASRELATDTFVKVRAADR